MPKVKTGLFESNTKTRHSLVRLEIIDQLISKRGGIKTREGLLNLVNSKLAEDISLFTIDNDLRDLRDLIARSNSNVQLLRSLDCPLAKLKRRGG